MPRKSKKDRKPQTTQGGEFISVGDVSANTGKRYEVENDDSDTGQLQNDLYEQLPSSRKTSQRRSKSALDIFKDSSDDSSSSDFEDIDHIIGRRLNKKRTDDDGTEELLEHVGSTSWNAKKKKHFYGGNPNLSVADSIHSHRRNGSGKKSMEELLVDGMTEAELEAVESKQIQSRQIEEMDESDFFDTCFEDKSTSTKIGDDKSDATGVRETKIDVSNLSRDEKLNLLSRESPEFESLMNEMNENLLEIKDFLTPLSEILTEKTWGDSKLAAFVNLKLVTLLNYCVNIGSYLVLKAEKVDLNGHELNKVLIQYKEQLEEINNSDNVFVRVITDIKMKMKTCSSLHNACNLVLNVSEVRRKKTKKRVKFSTKHEDATERLNQTEVQDKEESSIFNSMTFDELNALRLMSKLDDKETSVSPDEDNKKTEHSNEESQTNDVSEDDESNGRRDITYEMKTNKGLKPKRSKLQRNPRTKNRAKYAKAVKRRKGQVASIRSEFTRYGGEMSGINVRVKKGIKLA